MVDRLVSRLLKALARNGTHQVCPDHPQKVRIGAYNIQMSMPAIMSQLLHPASQVPAEIAVLPEFSNLVVLTRHLLFLPLIQLVLLGNPAVLN